MTPQEVMQTWLALWEGAVTGSLTEYEHPLNMLLDLAEEVGCDRGWMKRQVWMARHAYHFDPNVPKLIPKLPVIFDARIKAGEEVVVDCTGEDIVPSA